MEKNNPLLWTMAITALGTVNAFAQTDATKDIITNAALSGSSTECAGWTLSGFNNNSENCLESYCGGERMKYSLKQKITLPAGSYTLVGYAFYRQGRWADTEPNTSHAKMVAGSKEMTVKTLASEDATYPDKKYPDNMTQANEAFGKKLYRNELKFTLTEEQEVEIGFEGTHNDNTSWFIIGSVELLLNEESLKPVTDELTQKVAVAVNKAQNVKSDESVQNALNDLSTLQGKINSMTFADYKAYKNGEDGNFAKQIAALDETISNAAANKKQYDAAKDEYALLTEANGEKTLLDNAYKALSDEAKKTYGTLYNGAVNAYNKFNTDLEEAYKAGTAGSIFSDEKITEKIKGLKSTLSEATKGVQSGNINYADYAVVNTAVNEALDVYTDASTTLYNELSNKNNDVYGDMYTEALVKLNAIRKNIVVVQTANENGKTTEDDKLTCSALKEKHLSDLNGYKNAIGVLLNDAKDGYITKANTLKANYGSACDDIKELTKSVATALDGEKEADFADVKTIKADIQALQDKVDAANKAHTIKGAAPYCEGYNDAKTAIENKVKALTTAVKEFKANRASTETITALQNKFNVAKTNSKDEKNPGVNDLVSTDKKYVVNGKYTPTEEAIQKDIDGYTTAAEKAYKDGKAVEYNNALNVTATETKIDDYLKQAKDVLAQYEKIAASIKADKDALAELTTLVADKDVTLDASTDANAKTYGTLINELNTAIESAQKALDEAVAKTDADHVKAMNALTVNTTIATDIAGLKTSYEKDKPAWDAKQQGLAKERMCKEANELIGAFKLPEEYKESDYGLGAAKLNTDRKAIVDAIEALNKEVENAENANDADAIAILPGIIQKIKDQEPKVAELNTKAADVKKEYDAEKAAKTVKDTVIKNLKDQLNGRAKTETEAEIIGVAGLNKDTNKTDAFAKEISDIQALITALETEIEASSKAETLRKDNEDTVVKEEGKEDVTVLGYNARVESLKKSVADLRVKAEAATVNWNAYNELKKYVADSKVAETIAKAKEGVKAATGDANTHYTTVVTGYENTLGAEDNLVEGSIWRAIEQAYAPQKYDKDSKSEGETEAKKGDIKARIDALNKEAAALPEAIKANEDANTALNESVKKAKEERNKVYTKITSEAEIPVDLLTTSMETLSVIDKDIETLTADVKNAHADGTCGDKKTNFVNECDRINNAISRVSTEWTDGYNKAVADYNSKTYKDFGIKLSVLKTNYSDAIDTISVVSNTKYAKDFVATLQEVTGEGGIYTYPEKIRTLQEDAKNAYEATKAGEVFDINKTFEAQAVEYSTAIKELSDRYTNKVNAYANEVYADAYAVAEGKYNAAVTSVKNFKEDVKKDAFSDVKRILDDSKTASGLSDFAAKLDDILINFEKFDAMIAAGKETVAKVQYDAVIADVEALTKKEAEDIANFHSAMLKGGVQGAYSKDYADLVEKSLTAAKKVYAEKPADKTLFEWVTGDVRVKIEILTGTYGQLQIGVDGDKKPIYETHTQKYIDAYNENEDYNANDTAWKDMLKACDDAQKVLDEFKADVKSLVIAHNETVNSKIAGYQLDINDYRDLADAAHKNNTSTDEKDMIVDFLEQIKKDIAGVNKNKDGYYRNVIEQEYNSIATAVATLKHDYDQATAEHIDDETIDGFKNIIDEYAKKNETLKSEYISGKKDKDGIAITEKVDGKDVLVYATWAETYNGYLALEKLVGQTRDDLANYYDKTLAVNAKSKLDEELAKVEAEYNAVSELLSTCHAPVVAKYQADADAMKAAIDGEKAHIQNDADDKTILLYQDNHSKDIAAIAEEYKNLKADIEKMEKPYDVNDVAYARLTKELDDLQKHLDEVNTVAAAYKYQNLGKWHAGIEGEEGYVEFDNYRDYFYYDISRYITSDRATVESLNATGTGLTENTQLSSKWLVELLTSNMEKSLAYYNADHLITELNNDYWRIKGDFTSKKYTDKDWSELNGRLGGILKAINNLRNYNNEADNGSIDKDIDGNPIYVENKATGKLEPGSKDIKYMDAYAEVYAKYGTVSKDIKTLAEDVDSKSYILGDVNHDGKVNMVDYTIARNILLEVEGLEVTPGMHFAADVNGDGDVNVGDLTKIANYIMTGEFDGTVEALVRSRYSTQSADALTLAVEGTGSKQRIVIGLANSVEYVAGQMDVKLPAGVRLLNESLSTRANGHELFSSEVNGAHRMLVSTVDNYALLDGEQALIYLDVEVSADYAGGAIEVSNVVFADADAHTYKLNTVKGEGDATGITELNTAEKVVSRIYTVGGQMVKSLKKGVNIIINSDGTTQKVLKK